MSVSLFSKVIRLAASSQYIFLYFFLKLNESFIVNNILPVAIAKNVQENNNLKTFICPVSLQVTYNDF